MKIVSARNTAFDLMKRKPFLAFLPVGATEQHSRHLRLSTDTVLADTLSADVVFELAWPGYAYLLPTLPVSSSVENTGYCGTVSFSPLTMRAIIRDMYQSLAETGIKYLVVCPWHGGNFILKPVIRELNRELGRCGVMYLNPWEHVPAGVYAKFGRGFEIHSGDVETSLMLACAPQCVRKAGKNNPVAGGFNPAWQDMWSMKTLSKGEGHAGHPKNATAEKGKMFRKSVVEYSARYLKQLLEMSKKYKKY